MPEQPDFYQTGHTYHGAYGWKFRVDTITTHPDDGERTALGWRYWDDTWEPYAYDEHDWDTQQRSPFKTAVTPTT